MNFHWPTGSDNDKKPRVMFYEFDEVLMSAIVEVAMQATPAAQECNNIDIELQAQARQVKEDMVVENMDRQYMSALKLYI